MSKQASESPQPTAKEVSKATLDEIIRHHMYASVGVGLFPLPLFDFVALTGIQLNMLRKLAEAYDIPFRKETAKNIVSSLIGGALPTTLSGPLAASVAKFVPFLGQTAGVLAMPVVSGAATYAIGKVFVQHFASGGTFLTFDPDQVRDYYEKMFREGQEAAAKVKKEKETEKTAETA